MVMSVISMLSAPEISSPANVDASIQYKNDYNGWKKKVRQLCRESAENFE